jgi:PhnB protein
MKAQIEAWLVLSEEDEMDKVGTVARRRFAVGAVTAMMAWALETRSTAQPRMRNPEKDPGGDAVTNLTPFLLFNGDCKQAMEFYKSCLGGELTQLKVGDSQAKEFLPPNQHHKILNARLKCRSIDISACDWLRPDRERVPGNTVCLYLSAGSPEELRVLFERLSEGADVTDPIKDVFFGTYGALNDKFGVRWMCHCS